MADPKIYRSARRMGRPQVLPVSFFEASARPLLAVEPVIQVRGTESPKLADVGCVNIAPARHLLQGLRMNAQEGRGLETVEQWLKVHC
jgi:hypothetical protein